MRNYKSTSLIPGFYISSMVFAIFALLVSSGEVSTQNAPEFGSVATNDIQEPYLTASCIDEQKFDDLTTLHSVRRYLSTHITYPDASVEAGHAGVVELYARVSRQGMINEICELQPDRNYTEIDEILITAPAPEGVEIIESPRHEELVAEGRRVIRLLPTLDMPEIYGGLLKLKFRFALQSED